MSNIGNRDILIGIDDTDNLQSRGTGYHARQLAHQLEANFNVTVKGISRHQLFVNPAIRYTSQNSSACIVVKAGKQEPVREFCESYLKENSAPGSDAGLCIARPAAIKEIIIDWGIRAKSEVLIMQDAFNIAREANIYLEGFTGTGEGIIGALAAVGLRSGGNDGRYIWRMGQKELRDMVPGIMMANELKEELQLDLIQSLEGEVTGEGDKIYINDWVRPIIKNNKAILIATKTKNNDEYEWKLATKEVIRAIS